jgi:hypothetical protein
VSTRSTFRFDRDRPPRWLNWVNGHIVDVIGGGATIDLDGSTTTSRVHWAFPFDRALTLDDGSYQFIYAVAGTKGVVVADASKFVREIDRSFNCANAYEYPAAMGRLPNGSPILVHCPTHYNRLVIERLDTGEVLAAASDDAIDVFHSRLQISPDGGRLLSAGWLWHPVGVVHVFDLGQAIESPTHLDGPGVLGSRGPVDCHVEAACWLSDDLIALSASPREESLGWEDGGLERGEFGVWSLSVADWRSRSRIDRHTGAMHRIGEHVLATWDHPQLVDPASGEVIEEWPELKTGHQEDSLLKNDETSPPFAVDADAMRFVVAADKDVVVVEL